MAFDYDIGDTFVCNTISVRIGEGKKDLFLSSWKMDAPRFEISKREIHNDDGCAYYYGRLYDKNRPDEFMKITVGKHTLDQWEQLKVRKKSRPIK